MKRIQSIGLGLIGITALVAACGAPFKGPDVITRDLPGSGDAPHRDASIPYDDVDADAGLWLFDGGACCVVRFAVAARPDDLSANWVGPFNQRQPMTRQGNVWESWVCMPASERVAYYFEASLPVELDPENPDAGGAFVTERFNPSVPQTSGDFIATLNVYDSTAAMSCEALDAGIYGIVIPADAGTATGGGSAAGGG